MEQRIIGICGPIGHGKTTFSDMLAKLEPSHAIYESGQLVAEVAQEFNTQLADELQLQTATSDIELVNNVLLWLAEPIETHARHRTEVSQLAFTKQQVSEHPELFEKLFAYLQIAKANPQLLHQPITTQNKQTYRPLLQWLGNYLIERISKTIWFDGLFRRVHANDAQTKLIIINGLRYPADAACVAKHGGVVARISRPTDDRIDAGDPTEAQSDRIQADIVVHNDGTLDQLRQAATQLWQDWQQGVPQPTYQASRDKAAA